MGVRRGVVAVVGRPTSGLRGWIVGLAVGLPLVVFVLLSAAPSGASATVWLCKPGQTPDPCTPGLSTTIYTPAGKMVGTEHPIVRRNPPIDCFYVYPTVSDQTTGNANLDVDPEERSIALYQAARYSQYCRLYAPMYRQVTLTAIPGMGTPTTTPNPALGFSDVQSAFDDYLEHYNHGRGFVLIGHSQGSVELRQLISMDIDPKRAVRRRLVSAILLGGNVLVKQGSDIGGDFKHIPGCHSNAQIGCVIAWSTFDQPVPSASLFGRPSSLLTVPPPAGDAVLCTNPATLSRSGEWLDPIAPSAPFAPGTLIAAAIAILGVPNPMPPTVWWAAPHSYTAQCETSNGANVLEVTPSGGAPMPTPSPDAAWGLHLMDANIALGNLIEIVEHQAEAFVRHTR
jgi:Protein of unknown function (DUF3089)